MTTDESKCEVFAPLISGALDGELTQQQQQHLYQHLSDCAKCQRLYTELESVQFELRRGDTAEHLLQHQNETTSERFWPRLGWLLMLLGVLPLLGFAGYQFLSDSQLPIWVRIASGSMILGALILFIYVARQRMVNAKTDNYKKVQL